MEKKIIRKFDIKYLEDLLAKDNALLLNTPDKLHGGVIIDFECKCNTHVTKLFRDIKYYGGAYCKECRNKNKTQKIKDTCLERYGVVNPSCIQDIKNKKEATYLEHYGMHPRKTEEVKEKYKKKCLERYNTDNTAKIQEVRDKIKQTFEEKYGGHPMHNQTVKDKVKDTCLERYGGYPAESEAVRDKMQATTFERFGCYHAAQNSDIMEKMQHSGKKYKPYIMPSGESRQIQGYENFALNMLTQQYTEEQIKTNRKDVPRILYTYNDTPHYYFPDIYLPHINLIIEVKSSWTYKRDENKNKAKREATEKEGFQYEFWIFDSKGNRISIDI